MMTILTIDRLKNGSVVRNSSEYLISHSANLPDYTTNTLSYVQVDIIITRRRYDHI